MVSRYYNKLYNFFNIKKLNNLLILKYKLSLLYINHGKEARYKAKDSRK